MFPPCLLLTIRLFPLSLRSPQTALGVKETPSPLDYCAFLADLAEETRGSGLNPNELRATVAIVHSVALDLGGGSSGGGGGGAGQVVDLGGAGAGGLASLFVPDENSVLRQAGQCVVNDDPWMRGRAGTEVTARVGLHVLHPALAEAAVIAGLGLYSLSEVLVERAEAASLVLHAGHDGLAGRFGAALRDAGVVAAVAALAAKSGSGGGSATQGTASLQSRLSAVTLRFVSSLPTRLVMLNPRQPRAPGVDLTGPEEGQAQALAYVECGDADAAGSTGGAGGTEGGEEGATLYVNVGLAEAPLTVEVAVGLGLCRCGPFALCFSLILSSLLFSSLLSSSLSSLFSLSSLISLFSLSCLVCFLIAI